MVFHAQLAFSGPGMQGIAKPRWLLVLPILLAGLMPLRALAQDDPNETPLGDVARNLRKKNPPAQQVIDDDNLPKVMQQAESERSAGSALKFLMTGEEKGFHVAVPDATCSLAFTANVKSLLSGQYSEKELPPDDLAKLDGPAVIEGDALTINVFNGTNWHLSELAVALTLVRKTEVNDVNSEFLEVRPEKKPDLIKVYRMRAAGSPWDRTVFSAPLNLELAPDEEWHWAIVQAKGYPPQDVASNASEKPQVSAQP
jgi:hypothetical protein